MKTSNTADFKDKQTIVLGNKGTGKTYFCKWLCRQFKRHLVIDVNHHISKDYEGYNRYNPDAVVGADLRAEIGELLSRVIIPKSKKIDLIIFEEADLFLPNHSTLEDVERQLLSLNRHYEIATVFVTRRPALVNTNLYALSNNIVSFRLTSDNDIKRISQTGIPQHMLMRLSPDVHDFVFFDGTTPKIRKVG